MGYTVLESVKNQDQNKLREQFALDVLMGLSSSKKHIPSKYLYDEKGSELFAAICDQPEYYPTNKEAEIFKSHKENIAKTLDGQEFNLIELGAGDGRKTKILLEEFTNQNLNFTYIPIDISEEAMKDLTESLTKEFPQLNVKGIVGDYIDGLDEVKKFSHNQDVVFFLGSNIGNFSKSSAIGFLRQIWNHLEDGDHALIGYDLKKNISTLNRAYNDSNGVTAAFNLNLLERINRELNGEFKKENFYHYGFYNPNLGALESHLVSLKTQDVAIKEIGKVFHFEPYESIHVEYSYKYHKKDIHNLAEDTGFSIKKEFTDPENFYVDSLWQVNKLAA